MARADRLRRTLLVVLALGGVVLAVALLRHRAPPSVVPPGSTTRPSAASAPPPAPSTRTPLPSAALPPPAPVPDHEPDSGSVADQRRAVLSGMERELGLGAPELERVSAIFERSDLITQGNPKISRRAMTRGECRKRRELAGRLAPADPSCRAANMVPLLGADRTRKARVCIDQFEFPNVPCEYPLVWVRANEASDLCRAVGKRLCDAHEWEGGCAGTLREPDAEYAFGERRIMMEYLHNKDREIVWAYGREQNHARCATGSRKSPKCTAGGYTLCGTNDYPAGSFPECVSPLGVYDQHGNVAEHMNLPLTAEQLGARGGLGQTEMKGSWFIFATAPAHEDDCRFRAPGWHASPVAAANSHRNYHLGFRCCRDLAAGTE